MNELLEALVNQAFKSQNERIESLKQEIVEIKQENKTLKEKIKDLEELNDLFDENFNEIKDYIRTYVAKEVESNLMEEYKFGEQ